MSDCKCGYCGKKDTVNYITDIRASKADKAEEVREAGMRGVQDRLYADVQTVRPVALIRPVRPVELLGFPAVRTDCTNRWHQVFGCIGDSVNCTKAREADKAGLASEAGNEG